MNEKIIDQTLNLSSSAANGNIGKFNLVFKSNRIFALLVVLLTIPFICWQAHAYKKSAQQVHDRKKLLWCAKAVKESFPRHVATGNIKGFTFKVTRAIYFKEQGYLRLEDKHPAPLGPESIGIRLWTKKIPKNRTFLLPGGAARSPHIDIKFERKNKADQFTARQGYGLRLHFAEVKDGKLPGYIILKLPYVQKSYIAGYFVARVL